MTTLLLLSIIVLSVASVVAYSFARFDQGTGFFSKQVELPVERSHWLANLLIPLLFIVFAYGLSVHIRYTWIDFAEAHYVTESGEKNFSDHKW